MKEYNVVLLRGDGIGPEIVKQAVRVLSAAAQKHGFVIKYDDALMGGIALDTLGVPLPEETLELCKKSDAVLLGAVGGYQWDNLPGSLRPEAGLLGIRRGLELFANLRPATIFPALRDASLLKSERIGKELDILIVRELTGGIYFGQRGRGGTGSSEYAYDTEKYSVPEIKRIARVGFDMAMKRNRRLCSVDKANILESSRLWREVVTGMAEEYPEVSLTHMYVDNCAMQLVRDPSQFDVIVTSNMFGDILSDEAAMLSGSIGMLPSASLGEGNRGLYEPVHGSAPDIAGQDIANPLATILSVAMMLRYSLDCPEAADEIERTVSDVLQEYRTPDIWVPGTIRVGCSEMGDKILKRYNEC